VGATSGGSERGAEILQAEPPRMFGLAYRLLGSATEADEAVRDASALWRDADPDEIASQREWLGKTVTRLCVHRLAAARARRDAYVGTWLPEPVATEAGALGPLENAEQKGLVSFALMTQLERLNPMERAVFVLREALGASYREIAGVLDLSEPNCRQLASRARGRLGSHRTRLEVGGVERRRLLERFLAAARVGDLARLEQLLAVDVVAWIDGGGRVPAALRPVLGRVQVARYISGGYARVGAVAVRALEINGQTSLVATDPSGALVGATVVEIAGSQISRIRSVVNPDKLRYLASQLAQVRPSQDGRGRARVDQGP
jgi:DNA-directed RNA polymerase specialized sigma24 family protein